jgi:hypothetical protein
MHRGHHSPRTWRVVSLGAALFAIVSCDRAERRAAAPAAVDSVKAAAPRLLHPEDVSLVVREIASSAHAGITRGLPNNPGVGPPLNGSPDFIRLRFDADELPPYVDYLQRQLLVFPVEAYQRLYHGPDSVAFARRIASMQVIVKAKPARIDSQPPVLPPAEATPAFAAQVGYVAFQDGSGVRYVTRYTQELGPKANERLFYAFQGLTSDGRYYVSFFHPVIADKLATKGTPPATRAAVDALGNTDFVPPLAMLDRVVASLRVSRADSARK